MFSWRLHTAVMEELAASQASAAAAAGAAAAAATAAAAAAAEAANKLSQAEAWGDLRKCTRDRTDVESTD